MPQSIEAVVEEWEGEKALESNLDSRRPSGNGSDHRLCLEVPSGDGSSQIGEAEDIERAREDDGSETVEA